MTADSRPPQEEPPMTDLTNTPLDRAKLVGDVEEWRVTGNPADPEHFPPYDFTWNGPDAERKARTLAGLDGFRKSVLNVKVSRRVITYGAWEDA